jgi:hypothetical protein
MRQSTDANGRTIARLAVGLAAALLLTADAQAGSISFVGEMAGMFGKPAGGPSTGEGTASITFGSSTLTYTGVTFTASAGEMFSLGSFTVSTGETTNAISAVDVGLNPNLTSGAGSGAAFIMPLTLSDTPDLGQRVMLQPNAEIGEFLGSDGLTYGLVVKGFGSPDHLAFALAVGQSEPATGTVFAEFVAKSGGPSTPEPATLVLAAVGVVTVGVRRWRR